MADEQTETGALRGDLRRADKVMTCEEVGAFLASAYCGRTATVGSDGFPYVVPNLFVWMDGEIFLHTARHRGHFLANVDFCERVCFEADEPGETFAYGAVECDTSIAFRSVIAFGRIAIVSDSAVKRRFYERFMAKYAPADSWGRAKGSFPRMDMTVVYSIRPEVMTGKQAAMPPMEKRWHALQEST